MAKIKELKHGDFFTKKPIEYPNDNQVWIRKEYDRSQRKYVCQRFSDINDFCYLKGDKEVFTELIF